jgi:hypothetical protein
MGVLAVESLLAPNASVPGLIYADLIPNGIDTSYLTFKSQTLYTRHGPSRYTRLASAPHMHISPSQVSSRTSYS